LVKILSLDGNGKMSKSENQMNTLYLADDDESIRKKIMKARTDQGPDAVNSVKPDFIENLFGLLKITSTPDVYEKFNTDYNNSSAGNCVIRYGDFKKQLAEDMVAFIKPIREKADALLSNPAAIQKILQQGKEKAMESANKTIKLVREAIGVNY
jgi:tryptophanyl-tRNA synthetase